MKAIFLDRDGVINQERGDYTYQVPDFIILPGVISTLTVLKNLGYKLIVVTNQAGIAQGIYSRENMNECHRYFQQQSENLIDHFYYAPGHPSVSESLSRKPDTLLFERAIAKFSIDTHLSFMVGDRERDLIPAKGLGMKTVLHGSEQTPFADYYIKEMPELLPLVKSQV
jgi:D-glycero-D-manno-heptose 1,7-bisphosphate phosphatase